MCLLITNATSKQIAKENILVFKVVTKIDDKIISYYYDKEYKDKGIYNSDIIVRERKPYDKNYSPYKYAINKALHSYEIDTRLLPYYKRKNTVRLAMFCGSQGHEYSGTEDTLYIGLFVIPTGAIYYSMDGMCASNKLIYTGKCYDVRGFLWRQQDFKSYSYQYANYLI